MNSSKKTKLNKAKSRREHQEIFDAALARAEAAAEVNAAKVIANAPAINARINQEVEERRRELEEAVRIREARRVRVTEAWELLVKVLDKLGSDQIGERAAAALIAERLRAKLGKTWGELIVREDDDDEDCDEDCDYGGDDNDYYDDDDHDDEEEPVA